MNSALAKDCVGIEQVDVIRGPIGARKLNSEVVSISKTTVLWRGGQFYPISPAVRLNCPLDQTKIVGGIINNDRGDPQVIDVSLVFDRAQTIDSELCRPKSDDDNSDLGYTHAGSFAGTEVRSDFGWEVSADLKTPASDMTNGSCSMLKWPPSTSAIVRPLVTVAQPNVGSE